MPYSSFPSTPAIPQADVPQFYDWGALSPGQFFSPPYYIPPDTETIFQGWTKSKKTNHQILVSTYYGYISPGDQVFHTNYIPDAYDHESMDDNPNTRTDSYDFQDVPIPLPWSQHTTSTRGVEGLNFVRVDGAFVYEFTDWQGNLWGHKTITFTWDNIYVYLRTLTAGRSAFSESPKFSPLPVVVGVLLLESLLSCADPSGGAGAVRRPRRN